MPRKVVMWLVLVGILSLAAEEGIAQVGREKIIIAYPSVSSTGGAVPWIAKEKGFFTAGGIDAELVYTSGALSMQALMGGSVDLVLGGIFDPLSAIAAGADIVVIRSFNNSAPYVMAARPDVRELKDLRGRKVGVRSLTGPATTMTQFMLEEAGLDAKRDVTILRVGGTAVRLTALKDGQIDAALVDEAVAQQAKDSGLNVIYLRGVPHIHTGVYVRRSRLQQREALFVAALQALRDAAVYMKANKAGVIEVFQKMMKVNDGQVAEGSYEVLKETLVSDPRIPVDAIRQSLKLTVRSDGRVKNIDVNKVFDMKIANRVMESRK